MVYYANYLKFMERARTEWLRSLGLEQYVLSREEGILFAVRSASVEFLRPARLDDRLEVTARLLECRRASFTIAQSVSRPDVKRTPLCTGKVRIACLDRATLRPHPIPDHMLKEMIDVG
jgi:acyl-CoA thioester hydrolase